MSKKLKWALVIGLATAGIGAGTTYAATNGNDQLVISKAAVSGDVKMERGAKKEIRFQMKDQTELLNLLKLDKQALQDRRAGGQSLAEIAQAQGVTRQQLIDVLTKQHETQLAKAVEAGKMTQAEADSMKGTFAGMVEKMIDAKGEGHFKADFGMKQGFRIEMADQTELLNLLKLDAQALRDKREAGQSLAEIAEAQGVTRQQLIDVLTKQHETQLAKAVEAGKMTQEQADSMKDMFPNMVAKMIDDKGPGFFIKGDFIKGDFMKGDGMKKGFRIEMADQTELLNLLKLDKQALQEKRASGQSLAEIAQTQGVTRQQLIDVLVKQHETQLAKAVEAGKMTQEQADSMKGTFSGMVDKMIDAKGHGDFKMENGKGKFLFKGQIAEDNK